MNFEYDVKFIKKNVSVVFNPKKFPYDCATLSHSTPSYCVLLLLWTLKTRYIASSLNYFPSFFIFLYIKKNKHGYLWNLKGIFK